MITGVKVGHYTYRVVHIVGLSDGRELAGQVDYTTQEIRLRPGLTPAHQRETLLHEVLHAIDDFMGIDLTEKQVGRLANGLAMVLADNPALLGDDDAREPREHHPGDAGRPGPDHEHAAE